MFMRIALCTDTFFPQVNGVVNVVHMLADALVSRGHTVCVFALSSEDIDSLRSRPEVTYEVQTIASLPVPLYPGERVTLPVGVAFRQLRAFAPDVIHIHTPFAMGREAVIAARRLNVPLVGTHHTFYDQYLKLWRLDYPWARHLSWRFTNRFYNHCARVVCPTRALALAMQSTGLKAHVEILPNPVLLQDFTPREIHQDARRETNERSIAYMGRLSAEKDIDMVLRAFAALQQLQTSTERERTKLVLIGDGPERAALEALAAKLHIGSRTVFTGFLRKKALSDELRRHDVFVTASRSENMPVSVLEAMATGLPVVAVDALGMPELVRDGQNGFVVAPSDAAAMAERFALLLRDDSLRKTFGEASRLYAQEHDPLAVAGLHEALYETVLTLGN